MERRKRRCFYDAIANAHGLEHDPWKALVVPRPISRGGICNLAPYRFFNATSEKPHYVMFGSAGPKDSVLNIEATGEFVCSLANYELRFNMNATSPRFRMVWTSSPWAA